MTGFVRWQGESWDGRKTARSSRKQMLTSNYSVVPIDETIMRVHVGGRR